jgi:hypothetical protein
MNESLTREMGSVPAFSRDMFARKNGGAMRKTLCALLFSMALATSPVRVEAEPGDVVTVAGYEFSTYGHRWDVCDVSTVLPRFWLAVPRLVVWSGIYPSQHLVAQAKTTAGEWQDKEYTVGCRSWMPLGVRFIPFALLRHDIGGFGSLDFQCCPWSRFWLNTSPDTALRAVTSGSMMDLGGTLGLTVADAFSLTLRAGYLMMTMSELSRSVSASSGYSDVHFPRSVTGRFYVGVQIGAGGFQPPPDDARWHPNEFTLVPMVTHVNRQERLRRWEAGGKSAEILGVIGDNDRCTRDSAITALGRIGDSLAVSGLTATLTDERADARAFAAFALGKLGSRTADSARVQGEAPSDSAQGFRDGWALERVDYHPYLSPYVGGCLISCLAPGALAVGAWTSAKGEKATYGLAAAGSSLLAPLFMLVAASSPHVPSELPVGRSASYLENYRAGYARAWNDNLAKVRVGYYAGTVVMLGITLASVLMAK